jgi:hypothetical protein
MKLMMGAYVVISVWDDVAVAEEEEAFFQGNGGSHDGLCYWRFFL